MVVLHGYGESLASWDEVAGDLSRTLRVVAVDLRGHGQSDWAPDGDYSLEATVQDLESIADRLGLQEFAIAGHSTGGMTSLAYSAAHPDRVSALALLETDPLIFKEGLELLMPFRGPEILASFEAFVDAYADRGSGRRSRDRVAARLRALLRQRADGSWTWRQDPRLRPREKVVPAQPRSPDEVLRMLDAVRAPVLLLTGEKSPLIEKSSIGRVLAHLRHSRAQHEEIPRAGHALLAENPRAVAQALIGFLARQP